MDKYLEQFKGSGIESQLPSECVKDIKQSNECGDGCGGSGDCADGGDGCL